MVRLPCEGEYRLEGGYPEFAHQCNLQFKKLQKQWKIGGIQVWGFLNARSKKTERPRSSCHGRSAIEFVVYSPSRAHTRT